MNKTKVLKNFSKGFAACALFCALFPCNSAFCEEQNVFNLTTIVDNFLNLESETKSIYDTLDEKTRQKREFLDTTRKFNQGNVSVAYNDYLGVISRLDNDFALFVCAKTMYEIGFFTLGDEAISKIQNKDYFKKQIEEMKTCFKGGAILTKQEEIFLAKAYTSIYFDNTPEETAFDLNKKTGLLEKSDYANFIMAQALLESRQYQQALMFVDYAIEKNPKNSKYLSSKIEILTRAKKYKEALKFLEEEEKAGKIAPELRLKVSGQKETIFANLTNNENEKKFHNLTALYFEGNYYKVINECQNILNFNKDNFKFLTLQGKCFLSIGKIEQAEKNFKAAYELNKNYFPALIGLGDIAFLQKNFHSAENFYKKALKLNKEDKEALLKLAITYEMQGGGDVKNLAKIQKDIQKNVKDPFFEYYLIATSIYKNEQRLRREYLIKSLAINPFYKPATQEYFAVLYETGKINSLQNFLYMVSFSNDLTYYYYYYGGIVEDRLENKEEAVLNLRHALVLNPDFEPAQKYLNNIELGPI